MVSHVYSRGSCHVELAVSTEGIQKYTGGEFAGSAAAYPKASAEAARAYMLYTSVSEGGHCG